MTQSGIDPATFRFVAQYLNHCATACPIFYIKMCFNLHCTTLSEILLILRKMQRDKVINIRRSVRNVTVIIDRF
jgi:hypothetical protein